MIYARYFDQSGVMATCARSVKVINDTQPLPEQRIEAAKFGKRHSHYYFQLFSGSSTDAGSPITELLTVWEAL